MVIWIIINITNAREYLTGNKLKEKCDWVLDETDETILNLKKTRKMKNGDKVFVGTHFLKYFVPYMQTQINTTFVLITHNSDDSPSEQYIQIILKNKYLLAWYAQNANHRRIKPIPIGIANNKYKHGKVKNFIKVIQQKHLNKTKDIFLAFTLNTNKKRYKILKQFSGLKNIKILVTTKRLKHIKYLQHINQSKFTVSPEGNGIDCHRTWEALILNSVPIVQDSYIINEFKKIEPNSFLINGKLNSTYLTKSVKKLINSNLPYLDFWWKQISDEHLNTYSQTNAKNGRLGNQIIRNIALSILAQKYDLYVQYSNYSKINNQLGIPLFVGKNKYKKTKVIKNKDFILMYRNTNNKINSNLDFMKDYFQNTEITNLVMKYIHNNKHLVMEKNPYKHRYNNNNDIFLHIRLTDAKTLISYNLEYYIDAIKQIESKKIIIATDNFNDTWIKQIHKKLKSKYQIKYLEQENEIQTIQFASTCKHIVLSHGTFSANIGYMAFFAKNIFIPNFNTKWHDIGMFKNKGFNAI